MFFFAYDLKEYKDELRGFYFDYFSEIPGPISQTTDELISQILNYKVDEWNEKYEAFADKFNTFDQGNAAKQVIELIQSL